MAGPVYTYTLCTPDAASPMNQTQPLILANFRAINELFEVNHVGWFDTNVSTNFGAHNFLSIPNQTVDPETDIDEIVMFTFATTGDEPCELFIRYPRNGVVLQISAASSSPTGTSGGDASQGWVTFTSGITFRWGNQSVSSTSSNIDLTEGTLYTTQQYPISTGPSTTGAQLPIGIFVASGTGFTVSSSLQEIPCTLYGYTSVGVTVEFSYFLIGT